MWEERVAKRTISPFEEEVTRLQKGELICAARRQQGHAGPRLSAHRPLSMNTSCRLSLHQCSNSRNVHHIQAWTLVPAPLSFPKGTESVSFQIRASMSRLPGQPEPFFDQLAAPGSASSAHTCPHLPLNAPSRPHPIHLYRCPCWTVLQHCHPGTEENMALVCALRTGMLYIVHMYVHRNHTHSCL